MHHRQDHAFGVAERDVLTHFQPFGEGFGHIQRDRHRPEAAVGQAHLVDDPVIVGLGQKALKRIETAIHQQLEIADLARAEIPGWQGAGFELELLCTLR